MLCSEPQIDKAYFTEIFVLCYYHEYFIVCFCRLSVNLLIGISEMVVIRKHLSVYLLSIVLNEEMFFFITLILQQMWFFLKQLLLETEGLN